MLSVMQLHQRALRLLAGIANPISRCHTIHRIAVPPACSLSSTAHFSSIPAKKTPNNLAASSSNSRQVALHRDRSSNLAPDVLRYQIDMLLAKADKEPQYQITGRHLGNVLLNLKAVNDRALVRVENCGTQTYTYTHTLTLTPSISHLISSHLCAPHTPLRPLRL